MKKLLVALICGVSMLGGVGAAECSECKAGIACAANSDCPRMCYCMRAKSEPKGECQSKWGRR